MRSNPGVLVGVALVVAGAVAVYFGYRASQGLSSEMTELFTGDPSDRVMWRYTIGAVLIGVGGTLLFYARPSRAGSD